MSRTGLSSQNNLASALALSAALVLPNVAMPADITLRSADGTVNIVGEFVDFVDNSYVIKTGLGDIRVSASRVSCIGDACPTFGTTKADVTLAGSDTLGVGIMPLLLSGYAASRGALATITSTGDGNGTLAEMVADEGFGEPMGAYLVSSSSSADAFEALLDGSAAIGMSARRILPEEARALRSEGAGNMIDPSQEHILALDTLVVIVHPNNPVETLTLDQLRSIYAGQITNWVDVGGNDAPITIVNHAQGSDTRDVFNNTVFNSDIPAVPTSGIVAQNNNDMAATVNSDVNAIGYSGFAFQRGAQPVKLINECGLSMTPDSFSARTEEYALQRPLYLYNKDNSDPAVRRFLDYAISPPAEEVITKAGFINLGVDRRAQAADSDRAAQLNDRNVDAFEGNVMQEMSSLMVDFDRLSTTFRFQTGSENLGQRGMLNLERLVRYLEKQPADTTIMLVGFTDDVGPFQSNRELSIARAEGFRDTLREFAGNRLSGVTMDVAGFGEIAPAACNITDQGRRINRRVEVWIRNSAG
ncbi:phosphate ABC transporter substrate-binding/OmpA family protein [Yoonia sp. 2307UL14-13]|uniref:phosphate ABC transporter substrate-binding/OmpA family protein n=1 Tax=Yoonia sp. 2307UL14-13 TaxID=3126506 RepID=UPI0030A483B3